MSNSDACKKYYQKNKERISEYKKQWYLKNRERILEKTNTEEYRQHRREYMRLYHQQYNEYQKLKKDNNELRRIYMSTAKKLKENGNDELAGYFYAQIDAVPTFTVETFDWYEMYNNMKKKYIKALELLQEYNMPCEKDDFMDSHTDYCMDNCSVDEEVYKKCWDKFIEWKLGEEDGK